ncbi:MAG: YggS family pyridoxal phosphate-dependent enzyme [Thermoguttaceae bacterium]|nr:YggS family pyridoxal phosphate-dependent enzyme [Thermoguttaceae bacterium]
MKRDSGGGERRSFGLAKRQTRRSLTILAIKRLKSVKKGAAVNSREAVEAEIKENVERVRERIDAAAERSGRRGSDVTLVAVSKYSAPDDGVVSGLLRAGAFDLGENRPQKFLEKANFWAASPYWNPDVPPLDFAPRRSGSADEANVASTLEGVASKSVANAAQGANGDVSSAGRLRWHFIGPLQRNKARRILPFVSLLHSVDSLKLLEALDRILTEENERVAAGGRRPDEPIFPETISALLEVRLSDDAAKQGFEPDELLDALPKTAAFRRVKIRGLMGMAGLTATEAETRRQFAALRELRDRCRAQFPEFSDFTELSMGMSGDFETAIEEGATLVRVGSILYPAT